MTRRVLVLIQEGTFEDGEPRIRILINGVDVLNEMHVTGDSLRRLLDGLGFRTTLQFGCFYDGDDADNPEFECLRQES